LFLAKQMKAAIFGLSRAPKHTAFNRRMHIACWQLRVYEFGDSCRRVCRAARCAVVYSPSYCMCCPSAWSHPNPTTHLLLSAPLQAHPQGVSCWQAQAHPQGVSCWRCLFVFLLRIQPLRSCCSCQAVRMKLHILCMLGAMRRRHATAGAPQALTQSSATKGAHNKHDNVEQAFTRQRSPNAGRQAGKQADNQSHPCLRMSRARNATPNMQRNTSLSSVTTRHAQHPTLQASTRRVPASPVSADIHLKLGS
jgi:hypothetical protein